MVNKCSVTASRVTLTISADIEIYHISHSNVDDTEKALVLLLKLLLIKDLYGEDRVFRCSHVKDFVPVWIQGLLND